MNLKFFRDKRHRRIVACTIFAIMLIVGASCINTCIDRQIQAIEADYEAFSYLDQPIYQAPPDVNLDEQGNTAVITSNKHHYSTWTFFNLNELEANGIIKLPAHLRHVILPDGREEEIMLTADEFTYLTKLYPDSYEFGVRTIWLREVDDFAPVNTHYMCINQGTCVIKELLGYHELSKLISELEKFPTENNPTGAVTVRRIIEDDVCLPDGRKINLAISLDKAKELLGELNTTKQHFAYYTTTEQYDLAASIARSHPELFAHERELANKVTASRYHDLQGLITARIRNYELLKCLIIVAVAIAIVLTVYTKLLSPKNL